VPAGNIGNRLNERQSKRNLAGHLLAPLRVGKPVALVVDDPRLPKRKRVDKPLLFITPIAVFGRVSSKLVVALQTHGCEVVDTAQEIKPMVFYRMGIGTKLAISLAAELNLVFTKGE